MIKKNGDIYICIYKRMIDLVRSKSEETRKNGVRNCGKNLNCKGMGYSPLSLKKWDAFF